MAWACTDTNIHDTPQAKGNPCITCHTAAYANVKTPVHMGVVDDAGVPLFPNTCDSCHSTQAWIPTTAGHPESLFPIMTGSHHNAAIGCTDCHIPSLGSSASGQNCDCIHCHINAHTTPTIDSTHTGVANYTPSGSSAPNYCLTCHPSG